MWLPWRRRPADWGVCHLAPIPDGDRVRHPDGRDVRQIVADLLAPDYRVVGRAAVANPPPPPKPRPGGPTSPGPYPGTNGPWFPPDGPFWPGPLMTRGQEWRADGVGTVDEVPEGCMFLFAGRWWTKDGRPGEDDLVIRPQGPPLAAKDPTRAFLTGFRLVDDDPPGEVWVTVQVPADLWGAASGAG